MDDKNNLKKIITNIIENEAKNNNLDIDLTTTNTKEYVKKETRLTLFYFKAPIYGIANLENNHIDIFLDNILSAPDTNPLFKAIETSYHESRHISQTKFKHNTYEGFYALIDNYIVDNILTKDPQNSFIELDAYLYGALKAKEYLLINKENEYYNNKEEIEELIKKHYINYNSINLNSTLEEFLSILKKKTIIHSIFKIKKTLDINAISPILNIFMKDTITFKSLTEILSNKRVEEIDKRIIYAFITNKYFLKTLDFNNLTNQELIILKEALIYTKDTYLNQYNTLNNKNSLDTKDAINIAKHQSKLLATANSIDKIISKLNNPTKKKIKQKN